MVHYINLEKNCYAYCIIPFPHGITWCTFLCLMFIQLSLCLLSQLFFTVSPFLVQTGLTQETLCWNGLFSLLISRIAGWKYLNVKPMIIILFCRLTSCVVNFALCPCSGSMEFVVPPADPSSFFPISVGFSASSTFSDLKVSSQFPHTGRMNLLCVVPPYSSLCQLCLSETFQVTGIHPLKEGNPPKFSQRARLLTANYQVV